MQNQKRKLKKRKKKKTTKQPEPYGYQPNNPLTLYYKKYIESDKS